MRTIQIILMLLFSFAIAACGGGGGSTGTATVTVSGTAAKGLPIANASITIMDVTGKTATAQSLANGSYSATVTGMTAPFLVQVPNPAGGFLYSVATASGTINITPLTDLIVRNWYATTTPPVTNLDALFTTPSPIPSPPTAANIAAMESMLRQLLSNYLVGAGINNPASFNLITTPFTANSLGFDLVLDGLTVTQPATVGGNVTIGVNGGGTLLTIPTTTSLTTLTPPPAPVADTQPSTAPGTITATRIGAAQVVLNWLPSTDNVGVAGYKVFRAAMQVGIIDQPFYVDMAAPAASACYTISAYDAAANVSAANTQVCAPDGVVAADVTPPTVPILTATASTTNPSSQIDLSWTASTDNVAVAGYRVMAGGATIASLPASVTTYTHAGLKVGTPYSYKIVALDSSGNAANSNVVAITLSTSSIIGSWSNLKVNGVSPTYGGGTNIVLTFFNNGDYMMAQSTTPPFNVSSAMPGIEHGTYTWNPSTGAFSTPCPTVDTNGQAGFSHPNPSQGCTGDTTTATVNGNTMTLMDNSTNPPTPITFERVADATNPLVGTWSYLILNGASPTFGGGTNITFTFFANGDYMMAQSETPPFNVSGAMPGLEHGTYTFDAATGAFATPGCPPIDTNGAAGLSHPGGNPPVCSAFSATASVSGNTLAIHNNINGNDAVFTRVTDAPAKLIAGSWYVSGNTNMVTTIFANGDYMHAKSVTTNPGAFPGIEHGRYTWDATTGVFAGACPPDVDTNGTDGLSHPNGIVACTGSHSTIGTAIPVSVNTVLWTVNGNPTVTLTRVVDAANPLVGSWYGGGNTNTVFTFFANGDYMQAQSVITNPSGGGLPGLEHGTYSWNPTTGAFVAACPSIDTNGTAGFSNSVGGCGTTNTITVNGNTATFTNNTTGAVTVINRVTP